MRNKSLLKLYAIKVAVTLLALAYVNQSKFDLFKSLQQSINSILLFIKYYLNNGSNGNAGFLADNLKNK